ncbi:MAG: inositol monophosphatase [Ignavibacteria bacterium]|nr:inositol monophosphatase [Ignavibacteria bacterium]
MIQLAIEVALEAGEFLKKSVGKIQHIEQKYGQERNLVTEIDRESEQIIIRRIKKRYPDHDFLAEESGSHEKKSDYRWVIDPLDGTLNFMHGMPIFCVSIGLEVKGEPVLGVVYDPNLNELFTAEQGKGAFLNKKPIRVSSTSTLIESMLVTGFPYTIRENPDNAVQHFVNFLMEAQAVRRLGSAALDICYVAAGRFDGFWEVSLSPWDVTAGFVIVREAGGTYTDFHGHPSTISTKRVLVSNGLIHEAMVEVLRRGLP